MGTKTGTLNATVAGEGSSLRPSWARPLGSIGALKCPPGPEISLPMTCGDRHEAETGAVAQLVRSQIALVAGLTAVILCGCSGVPYAPVPSLVPSPSQPAGTSNVTPTASGGSPSGTDPGPEVELRGPLIAEDGQSAVLTAWITLGELEPTPSSTGRSGQHPSVQGSATLTNPTERINVPAASVHLVFQAGYLQTSEACRALPPPDGINWGHYCWHLLATASPLGSHDDLVALQPGEERVMTVTTPTRGLGRVRVPKERADRVTAALKQPAVVVALTSAIDYSGTRVRGGCDNASTVVTPSGAAREAKQSAPPVLTQNAVIAATATLRCNELRYVGP